MRMTKQSRENARVAIEARVHAMAGAFTVELIGGGGARAWIQSIEGPNRYPTIADARRAVRRLNPALKFTVMPEI